MGTPYIKGPVVLVFKNSNRKNAKTKMKIFKNKNVDVVNEKKMPGFPAPLRAPDRRRRLCPGLPSGPGPPVRRPRRGAQQPGRHPPG